MSAVQTVSSFVERLYGLAGGPRVPARPFGRMVLVDDAEEVQQILRRPDVFRKQYALVELVGRSRFDTDGTAWEQRRALSQPTYQRATGRANRTAVRAEFALRLDALDSPDAQRLADAALSASAAIFHRAFGIEAPAEHAPALFAQLRHVLAPMQHAALFGAAPAQLAELRRQAKAIRAAFAGWGGAAPFGSFHSALAAQAAAVENADMLGEYLMNFFAGAETAAATMSWALDRLAAAGDFQDRVAGELGTDGAASPLLETFINETLRYFPPIPYLPRRVREPTQLGSTVVQPDQVILLSIIGVHHDPRHWDQPRRFDPERPEFAEGTYNRRAFIPFSMGARVCGGAGLARLELMEGLSAIVRRFRFARDPAPVRFEFSLALRPATLAHVRVERR